MARKRNVKTRYDYRQGGRVQLWHGGRPRRKDFSTADEHTAALQAWNAYHAEFPTQQSTFQGPDQPFKDTGDIPYGQTTDTQADLARKQIEDAAAGKGPGDKAVIKTPAKVSLTGTEFEDDAISKVLAGGDAKAGGVGRTPYETVMRQGKSEEAEKQKISTATKAGIETVADQPVDVTAATVVQREAQTVTEIRDLWKEFVATGMPSDTALEKAKAQLVDYKMSEGATAPELQRLREVRVEDVQGPDVEDREGQQVGVGELGDVLDLVTKEGTNLEDLGSYQQAATRKAQVGEAKTKIAEQLGTVPSKDADTRAGITSDGITIGDAAQIGGIPTAEAASMQAVTSTKDRTAAAADMLSVVGELAPDITAAISEDPATLEAELDTDPDPAVVGAITALPQEALVSVQMENLLGSLDTGEIPIWAKPAVAAVNNLMAERGLEVSTVGRDALFNAIIQMALPLAQGNAQALQASAAQHLNNQQQANLAQAQQIMQVRMENLSNQNVAAAQTASMAQQIKVQQGTFKQQAVVTTAEQRQQTRSQELQGEQQRAAQRSAQSQQAAISTFSATIQKDLADLQYMNIEQKENMTANQQQKLTEYNAEIAKVMRQADLDQEMLAAGINSDLQIELKNLTEQNATDRASMSEENKMRLANLTVLVDFKKTNKNLAQQMNLANMNNEQQMELAMLSDKAATDTANFTIANQFRLQELATTATVLSQNTELRTRAEIAQMSASEKVSLANLTARNQADSESMTAENVAELARYDKQMNAANLNANLAQQMGITQLSKDQEKAMFNAQITAGFDMSKFNFEQQKSLADSKFMQTTVLADFSQRHQGAMQDATATASLDLATADQRTKLAITNAQNFLQMDMKMLDVQQQEFVIEAQMRQQSLLSDQAAFNASEQFNAASQNQLDQYMAGLGQQIEITNKQRNDSMQQFNATQFNAAQARKSGNMQQARLLEAQLKTDVSKFNDQQNYNREQFNATSANQIEQFNINWRRDANKIDTAAINAVNQQNAMNAFGLSAQSMSFMWQELRDEMDYSFKTYDNDQQRKASLIVAALGNEAALDKDGGWANTYSGMGTLIDNFLASSG